MQAQLSIKPNSEARMKSITIARHRKVVSVINNSDVNAQTVNTLCMGVGTGCQVTLLDSLTLISNTNVNHQPPLRDDKSQPLD
jgi:hypothetical protein